MSFRLRDVVWVAGLAALFAPRVVLADTKTECVVASEKAQQLRDDRKLVEAREQFLMCVRDVCPAAVKRDCSDELGDLTKRLPSVVIRASDKRGQDLVAVRVTIDGSTVVEELNGHAIPLNPGIHNFRFEAAGQDPVEQKIVLAEGEHDRAVTAQIGHADETTGATTASRKPVAVGAIVVSAVGVLTMGLAPAFYATALNQKSGDDSTCAKTAAGCSAGEINYIKTMLVTGDILLLSGGVILAGGVIWAIVHYATRNKETSPFSNVRFALAPTNGGAMASALLRW